MHTRLTLALLLTTSLAGCGLSAPLHNSHESPEALARAVVTAIERGDVDTLNDLALNEQEFRDHVWPELPAARPERNLSVGYVWGDLHQKSNIALRQTLAALGGQKLELVAIRFQGEITPYQTYRVHRESELTVKGADGSPKQIRVFGSMLEKSGRFKVFSYVTED